MQNASAILFTFQILTLKTVSKVAADLFPLPTRPPRVALPVTNNSWPDEENGFLYSVAQEMLTQGFCPDKVRPNDAVAERESVNPR
jgi:hypothetical protein